MKRRVLGMLLIMMLAVSSLGGCKKNVGTPEDNAVSETEEDAVEEETGYLFGYSGIETSNPYFETLELSIRKELESRGHRLMSRDPKADAQLQNQQIQELIDEGVKAVFLSPVDSELISEGLEALDEAGVPVINIDTQVKESDLIEAFDEGVKAVFLSPVDSELISEGLEALDEAGVPVINIDTQVKESDLIEAFIGSDNKKAGFVCGEDLKKRLPNGGKVLLLECAARNSVNQRITGFEEAIANAGFEVLNRTDVSGEKEVAKTAMAQLLAEYSEIDAIMCGNDPIAIALGALEAIEEAGRSEILIYGVDGSPEVKAKLAENNLLLVGTGAQSPINIGKKAVETALAIMNGENYEKEVMEDTFLITRDNVELYGTDGWQ